MRGIIAEIEAIGPWLEGNLLAGKSNKYTKKDGSISVYNTSPVLQYRVGPKTRKSVRIKPEMVPEITRLLACGKRCRDLMRRYQALSAEAALDKKKRHSSPSGCPTRRRSSTG